MNNSILSIEELISLNEMMLGRGKPNQEDGVGYNKADYGACVNYYYGMSDAQIADLAKRLVKYSKTQLNIDKKIMEETAEYYINLVKNKDDRNDGVSLDIKKDETIISFKYNKKFISLIKELPVSKRRFDKESKQWIVSNDLVLDVLNKLSLIGADVKNALKYAKNHNAFMNKQRKEEILVKYDGDYVLLKFNYNEDIIKKIKEIDRRDREYVEKFKFWAIKKSSFDNLSKSLNDIAILKNV